MSIEPDISKADAAGSSDKEAHLLSSKEEAGEFLQVAILAVLFTFVIRIFFFEPFNIPSGSMKPTLLVGDYLFVTKFSYGYSRHSFPFGLAPIEGRTHGERPLRGDVIVFKLPTDTSTAYIKRVVGLPGDRVQMVDGRLYINRQRVPRDIVGTVSVHEQGDIWQTMTEYVETLPGGALHRIYEETDYGERDNTPEYIVPEDHVFVMGDNRDNSSDSRVQRTVGYIPYENIVGRADRIFFSTNGSAELYQPWKWPGSIRYDRIFNPIGPVYLDEIDE